MNAQIQGFIRHILTALGGLAVGKGWVDESTATQLVGGAATIIGFAWSFFAPEKKA